MTIEWVRNRCLALPHVTEDIKWETDLVFSVAKKMFSVVSLEPADIWISFKCTPEDYAELARISHQATVKARARRATTSLRLLAVLDGLSSTPALVKRRAPRPGTPSTHFPSPPGEKCGLVEHPGIRPAPYLARAQWVALESHDSLNADELREQLRRAYDCVFARLTKKIQRDLGE